MERRHAQIDWNEVRQRLARTSSPERDPDAARRILLERARRLASPGDTEERQATPAIAFEAEGERYAIATSGVTRIERAGTIVRLPGSPPFLLGVVPIRNRACPILHLPSLLESTPPPARPPRWAILLGTTPQRLALGADVVALVEVTLGALHPAPGDPERIRLGWTGDARTVLDAAALAAHAIRRLRGSPA